MLKWYRAQFEQMKAELAEGAAEMRANLREIESCFDILFPLAAARAEGAQKRSESPPADAAKPSSPEGDEESEQTAHEGASADLSSQSEHDEILQIMRHV
jgi:hypothetical protein